MLCASSHTAWPVSIRVRLCWYPWNTVSEPLVVRREPCIRKLESNRKSRRVSFLGFSMIFRNSRNGARQMESFGRSARSLRNLFQRAQWIRDSFEGFYFRVGGEELLRGIIKTVLENSYPMIFPCLKQATEETSFTRNDIFKLNS